MINDKRVLAIIPARGGSKGVPGKNIRMLNGKPLIAWTIEEANKSKYIDRAIVSSDDDAIIKTALEYGGDVPFKRPEYLAQDGTSGLLPVVHAIEELPGYDYVVLLQPTSPLRDNKDIDACIELCVKSNAFAVSITEPDKSPYWMFQRGTEEQLVPLIKEANATRRQDLPKVFVLNGAVYVASVEQFIETKTFLTEHTVGYVMPKERSIDIDTVMDFQLCEWLLETR
ncbi:cytidylyltransferase domain-containing protein [Paenibacillus gorillae]|uniref:acylneuraminate cytidylyltransferase family protein n=1 Tax=Paenibacillus gorillae TaxID=1243662 RepID=UPI0004B47501|nr:acylneuraminate cytidylyltransferase family protein [Paenibacillus gorillae]